ncbi:hypothetical protein BH20ACI4_BH20ACI4_34920 [soil metagenome]
MKIIKPIIFALLCAFFLFGCNAVNQTKSPTETLHAFNEASKKKDIPAIKSLLSKGTLALFEQSAKKQNKTIDDILLKDSDATFQDIPETQNEKIEGDTATVEVKKKVSGEFQKIPFVKEDGVWKLALDRFLDDVMKKMKEEMNKIPANLSLPDNVNRAKPETDSNANTVTNKK